MLAAAALDTHEREGFLDHLTAVEPVVLAEARRRLVLVRELPPTFLDIPAPELLRARGDELAAEDPLPVPTGVDRYTLLQEIGEGGMARVYKAFDRQLERPVAIKFLERLEPEDRQRFLHEAQAQARVRHDNVLEVYETGVLAGKPFIAMRWVDGPTIAGIRAETSLEQKVRLIAQVAEGLHAAHREGLIHRDVKPSNVLVEKSPDGEWKPWIADFGIALEWKSDGSTQKVGLAGTPAYLAPEMLSGDQAQVDRRADVYGLGMTLYELVTGDVPFASPQLLELLRQVREDAPPPPRAAQPNLPAELEAIILKCLEKQPEKRYPSARALAEDLERFLDGEVVEAHTATIAYRLTKFALRYRLLLVVSGVGLALLSGALVVAAILGIEARLANRRAEMRRTQAEELIGFMLTDLRDRLEPLGKLEILDGVGASALKYFAAVPEAELTSEELARRSQALYQIGDVRIRQGDLAAALPPLEESLALARALAEREPQSAERLFGLGQSHYWVGRVSWQKGDLAGARPHFDAYLEISQRLVAMDATRLDYQLELAYATSNLGSVLEAEGKLEEAVAAYRRTLEINQKLVAADPSRREWKAELADTHNLIGAVEKRLGHLDFALTHFRSDLNLKQELAAEEPGNARWEGSLATSHDYVGELTRQTGGLADGTAHFLAAREILTRLVSHDPKNAEWRYKLALIHLKLGAAYQNQGDLAGATAEWRTLADLVTELVHREPSNFEWRRLKGIERIVRATLVAEQTGPRAGRDAAEQGIELLELVRKDRPEDATTLRWLARGYRTLALAHAADGENTEKTRALATALEELRPAVAASRDVSLLAAWAQLLVDLGKTDEARPVLAGLQVAGFRDPSFWSEINAASSPANPVSP